MRNLAKIGIGLFGVLVFLLAVMSLRAQADPLTAKLREIAARAKERRSWPSLRGYAESEPDPERRGQAYFVLGYREWEAQEYPTAVKDLGRAADTGFSLADLARYYWAVAAHEVGQSDQAIEALESFSKRYPASSWRFEALAFLAKLLLEMAQPQRAIQVLTAEPLVRQRPPLGLLLAQAYWDAQKLSEAARIYQELYYAFPTASESQVAKDRLTQLRRELGVNFPEPAEEIQSARAEILQSKSRLDDALSEYDALLANRPASRFVPRWKLGRARCLVRLKRANEALESLQASFVENPEMEAQRLSVLVDGYLQAGDAASALQTLETLRALNSQSAAYASALSALGNFYVRQGEWKEAARYFQLLAESFPRTDLGREASWRVAWAQFLEGDSALAMQAFAQHLSLYPDSPHVPAALYWLGRLAEQRGAAAEARALYGLLQGRFVHHYYPLQARQRLLESSSGPNAGEKNEGFPLGTPMAALTRSLLPRQPPPVPPCGLTSPSEAVRPFVTLKMLSLDNLGEEYLLARLADQPNLPELLLALSRLRAEQRNPAAALLDAIKVVPKFSEYEFAALPEEIWNLLYPRNYGQLVKGQARANGLDPYLVMGLIRQESAFNPRATSSANARGLMQILPQTVYRSRRGRTRAAQRLYEPAYNVRLGCRYLRGLLKTFDGSLEQALAAYHAGDFRVKEWLGKHSFREPAEFVETIPITATRAYVESVLRDAAVYRQLMTKAAEFAKCKPAETPPRMAQQSGVRTDAPNRRAREGTASMTRGQSERVNGAVSLPKK